MPETQLSQPQEDMEQKDDLSQSPEAEAHQRKVAGVKDKYVDDNLEKISFTPKQAKETLGSKAKLTAYVSKRKTELQNGNIKNNEMKSFKEKQIDMTIGNEVYQMARALEGNTKALQGIVAIHLDTDETGIAHTIIDALMKKGNEIYFKGLFNNPKATSLVKSRAFGKIKDEQFKLNAVLQAIKNNEDFSRLPKSGVEYTMLNDRPSAEKVFQAIKNKKQYSNSNIKAVLKRELYGNSVWGKWEKN